MNNIYILSIGYLCDPCLVCIKSENLAVFESVFYRQLLETILVIFMFFVYMNRM